jgi:hypothetical protein
MKFVPERASRFVSRQGLKISKNSPTILLVTGIAGVVGTTVLASRATLKVQADIDEARTQLDSWAYTVDQNRAQGQNVPEDIARKKRVEIYTVTAVRITKAYAPAVVLGIVSVGCLVQGHRILNDRYSNLATAYVALQESFVAYRKRVSGEVGEEREKELYYDGQNQTFIEVGPNGPKKKNAMVRGLAGGSIYAKIFDENNPNWRTTPEYNVMFLRQVENFCNTKLRLDGHLFLNRVYEELGMDDTEEGAVCGWLYEKGVGDSHVDFGIWGDDRKQHLLDFMVGNEGAIMLDFNVAGPIHKLLGLQKVRG